MNRRLIFTLTFVLTLGIAASAWAGSFSDNDYQGRIESDHGTFFGFDLNKKNGVTKVAHVETVVKLQCTDGEGGPIELRVGGSFRVSKNDTFHGNAPGQTELRGSFGRARLSISGKLQKHGKAKGTVNVDYYFSSANKGGSETTHCYSGGVGWKAKRGAIVNPETQSGSNNRLR